MKNGFTLTECLIAMGIIGTIAALTIPSVSDQHNKKIYSTMLAANVANIENSMQNFLVKDNVSDITRSSLWTGDSSIYIDDYDKNPALEAPYLEEFQNELSDLLKKTPLSQRKQLTEMANKKYEFDKNARRKTYARYKNLARTLNTVMDWDYPETTTDELYPDGIKNASGSTITLSDSDFKDKTIYTLKNGTTVFLEMYVGSSLPNKEAQFGTPITENDAIKNHVELTKIAAKIIIDVNGKNKPNKIGRDIFYFALGTDGHLYPYGSKDVSMILNGDTNNNWSSSSSTYACTDSTKSAPGWGCTARLVENGYKMDY